MQIKVKRHLKAAKSREAVRILTAAFSLKLKGILGTNQQIEQVLLHGLNRQAIVVAYDEEKRVVGVATYLAANKASINLSLNAMIQVYGFFTGLYKLLLLALYFPTKISSKMLYMDAIAVDPAFRGQGIGTLLLAEIEQLAQNKQLTELGLDVIAENQQAKKLYEASGYQVDRYEKLSKRSSRVLGFTAYYHMTKVL